MALWRITGHTGRLRLVDMPMLPWDGQTVNHVFLYLLMWTTCNLISLHMSALLLYLLPQMLFHGQTFVNVYRFVTFVRYMQDFCLSVVGVCMYIVTFCLKTGSFSQRSLNLIQLV